MHRSIELVDGRDGRIIRGELQFNITDAVMIIGSMYCLNIFHPGRPLGPDDPLTKRAASLDSNSDSLEKVKESGELCSCIPRHIIDGHSKV